MFIFAFVSIGLTLANTFFRIDKAGLIQGKNWISRIKLSLLLWWVMNVKISVISHQSNKDNLILEIQFLP